jgi:hypothetical protein
MMESLRMEVISIVSQHASNALDPMMEDMFQYGPPNVVQKRLNAIKKILWRSELFSCQCALHRAEKPEVRRCQARTVGGMGNSNDITFSGKIVKSLSLANGAVVKIRK